MITRVEPAQITKGRDLAFWKDFPDAWEVANDYNKGIYIQHLGSDIPVMASNTANGRYHSYQDTGGTITPSATILHAADMATDGTDEDEVHLQYGGVTGMAAYFSGTAGSNFDQWYETVVQVDRITTNAVSYFAGLASPGAAVADLITDATGALSTTPSVVGFHSLASAPSVLRAIYNTAAGTVSVALASAATLVAGTPVRLGIRYRRGKGDYPAGYCEWWVNGVRMAGVAISTSNFPDALALSPLWGFKSTTATVSTLSIYAWRYGLIW